MALRRRTIRKQGDCLGLPETASIVVRSFLLRGPLVALFEELLEMTSSASFAQQPRHDETKTRHRSHPDDRALSFRTPQRNEESERLPASQEAHRNQSFRLVSLAEPL